MAAAVATLSAAVVAQSQSVSEEWKSLDVQGLTDLAEQFKAKGNAGAKDRERLAAYVPERYAAAKADGSLKWNEWLDLVHKVEDALMGQGRLVDDSDSRSPDIRVLTG